MGLQTCMCFLPFPVFPFFSAIHANTGHAVLVIIVGMWLAFQMLVFKPHDAPLQLEHDIYTYHSLDQLPSKLCQLDVLQPLVLPVCRRQALSGWLATGRSVAAASLGMRWTSMPDFVPCVLKLSLALQDPIIWPDSRSSVTWSGQCDEDRKVRAWHYTGTDFFTGPDSHELSATLRLDNCRMLPRV